MDEKNFVVQNSNSQHALYYDRKIKRTVIMWTVIPIIILILFFILWSQVLSGIQVPREQKACNLSDKHVVYIIDKAYRPKEYFDSLNALERCGAEIVTAGYGTSIPVGKLLDAEIDEEYPQKITVMLDLDDLNISEYDAIVLLSSIPTYKEMAENQKVLTLIKEANASGKIIGGISTSQIALANAGILNNRSITILPDMNAYDYLIMFDNTTRCINCTSYTPIVITDVNIITANGPWAAKDFGECIANELVNINVTFDVTDNLTNRTINNITDAYNTSLNTSLTKNGTVG